jgi:hypothetical protein
MDAHVSSAAIVVEEELRYGLSVLLGVECPPVTWAVQMAVMESLVECVAVQSKGLMVMSASCSYLLFQKVALKQDLWWIEGR